MSYRTQIRFTDFNRMLAKAREDGIKVVGHDNRGVYIVTSASEEGLLHRTLPNRCDCKGFEFHGRCKHIAAVIEHIAQTTGQVPVFADERR